MDKIFISTMPCDHVFISPIFPTKIYIYKKRQAPPPPTHCSNGGPLGEYVNIGFTPCRHPRLDSGRAHTVFILNSPVMTVVMMGKKGKETDNRKPLVRHVWDHAFPMISRSNAERTLVHPIRLHGSKASKPG